MCNTALIMGTGISGSGAAELLLRHIAMADKADKLSAAMEDCAREGRVVVTGRKDGASCREFTDYLLEKL